MAISFASQLARARTLAAERGPAFVSESLRRHAPSASAAAVAIASVREVDGRGRAVGDEVPAGIPVIAVLAEDGRLRERLETASIDRVTHVVFERGVLEVSAHGFVLLEVEDGRSAREVRAETGVPMVADARLTVFGGERDE